MTRWGCIKEALSQLLNAATGGYSDEMLSARAHRTGNKPLQSAIDWVLGKNHCKEMYDWEFSRKGQHPHYGKHYDYNHRT